MRFNKFMAMCGVASRRACDAIIQDGKVCINGEPVDKLGIQINADKDVVTVKGKTISPPRIFQYFMLFKPIGYITSTSDTQGRKTVMELLPESNNRLFPVGRLDYNTSGLLLITNDGDLTQKLTHPSFEFEKTYVASIQGNLTQSELNTLRKGVDIGGFITSPAKVEILKKGEICEVCLTIHEGKNRQVRRMFEALKKRVKSLKRVAVGSLTLDNLKEGQIRPLTKQEIKYLKSI